jgi:hypothetical protein
MFFDFTNKYQFATRAVVNNSLLEVIDETKLLWTVVSTDLKWHSNTEYLTRRGFQRMTILRKLAEFNVPQEDMTLIYCQYIRSVLEYNSSVWFSSITDDEKDDIERVQRCAINIIIKNDYSSYEEGLSVLNLENSTERKEALALRFAKKCVKDPRFKDLFPLNDTNIDIRKIQSEL